MKRLFNFSTTMAAVAMVMAMGSSVHAQGVWTGLGADSEYSTPENWSTGNYPSFDTSVNPYPINNNNSTQDINGLFTVERSVDTDVLGADDGTVATVVGNSTGRLFLKGGAVLNITGGSHQDHRSGANIFNFVGDNGAGTVNQSGGTYGIGHGLRIGVGNEANVLDGTYNLTGGSLNVFRGSNAKNEAGNGPRPSIEVGDNVGSGLFEISNDASLETRGPIHVGVNGTFSVVGSGHSPSSSRPDIGVGSFGSGDGAWYQSGTLKVGLDGGGLTSLFIDDVDDNGGGEVVFRAGSILDPYDAGMANNAWTTVLAWEATGTGLTDEGLGLSSTATTAGWEMQFVGTELQVRNTSLPDPTNVPGDFNGDNLVTIADVDLLSAQLGNAATVNPAMDLVVDGTINLADHDEHITTLLPDANGVGALIGDLNLDGDVDVSQISVGPGGVVNVGDASVLLANLGTLTGAGYADGDLNGDGDVDVSQISVGPGGVVNVGDASILLANLGQNTTPGAAPAGSAVPEPGSMVLLLTAGLGVAMRRRKR